MQRQPPLQLLPPFEASARLGSFKNAADELHVTPSAISQQVKQLEDLLGLSLFDRLTRKVQLTAAGAQFYELANHLLTDYRQAFDRFRERHERPVIRVSMIPFVAYEMVLPQLHAFQRQHPDIDLRIETSMALVDFANEPIDAAVRFGVGEWPGLAVLPLSSGRATVVCAPALLQRTPLRSPGDLQHHTLIHSRRAFDDWQSAAQRLGFAIKGKNELILDDYFSAMHAAAQGLGLAIAVLPITNGWIRDGRLAMPLPFVMPTDQAHVFVCRKDKAQQPAIRALYEWLQTLFEELDQQPLTPTAAP